MVNEILAEPMTTDKRTYRPDESAAPETLAGRPWGVLLTAALMTRQIAAVQLTAKDLKTADAYDCDVIDDGKGGGVVRLIPHPSTSQDDAPHADLTAALESIAMSLAAASRIMDGSVREWHEMTACEQQRYRSKAIRMVATDHPKLSQQARERTTEILNSRLDWTDELPPHERLTEIVSECASELPYQLERVFQASPWGDQAGTR